MTEQNFHRWPGKGNLRLLLVRHGETEANLKRLLQGNNNGLLTVKGSSQVDRLARHLKNIALDHVYSSDLQRAINTASAIAHVHGLIGVIDSRLREWNVGDLDGLPAATYLQVVKETARPLSI